MPVYYVVLWSLTSGIQLCTVLVENLPEDHSPENIRKIFCEAGKYVTDLLCTIMIHDILRISVLK